MSDHKKTPAQLSTDAPAGSFAAPLAAKISKISSLATSLSEAGQSGSADVWREQLEDLLLGYVKAGRDDVLLAAIRTANEKGGRAAADEICGRLERFVATRTLHNDDGKPFQMNLVAIPLVVLADDDFRETGKLPVDATLERLARSFQRYDIVRDAAQIGVLPYLYEAAELDTLKYSDVHKLTLSVFHAICGEDKDATSLAQSGWRVPGDGGDAARGPRLFYVLAGVIAAGDEIPFTVDPTTDQKAQDAYYGRLQDWSAAFGESCASLVGPTCPRVYAAWPGLFFEALELGAEHKRDVVFHLHASANLTDSNLEGHDARAIVQPCGTDGKLSEFRVTFVQVDDGKVRGGTSVFPGMPWNDYETDLEALRDCLEVLSLDDVEVAGTMLEASTLPPMQHTMAPEWTGHTLH